MTRGRWTLVALCVLAAAYATTVWVYPWSDERINDFMVIRTDAALFAGGKLPYRDVLFEYPPLAAPVIAAPALAGTDPGGYRDGFLVMSLALAAALLLLVRGLARSTGGDERAGMVAFALAPLLLGAVFRNHFDLAPVALTLGALLLVVRSRPVAGLAVLGLAGAMKGYPLVAAPVVLAWLLARGDRRGALRGGLALAGIAVAAAALAVAISPGGARDALRWQTDRPVQVESTPASILAVTGADTRLVGTYRSHGVEHAAAEPLAAGVAALGLVALVLLSVGVARAPSARGLVLAALAATAAYAAFGKVLSPQYLTWTLPLLALAVAWRQIALPAVLGAAALLTFYEFPLRYVDLLGGDGEVVAAVALRNLLLIVAVGLAVRAVGVRRRSARPVPA